MDQGPLVNQMFDAGAELAEQFGTFAPVSSAFWLKEPDSEWTFYISSTEIDDSNFDLAYASIARLLQTGSHIWLDPLLIKVINADAPIARSVKKLQSKLLPTRIRNQMIGDRFVEDGFIYPVSLKLRQVSS